MDNEYDPTPNDPDLSVELIQKISTARNWIYIIATLSLVNSLVLTFGGELSFMFGFLTTQFISIFTLFLAEEFGRNGTLIINLFSSVLIFFITGLYAGLGWLGSSKQMRWPLIAALGIYLVDTLFYLFWGDFLSAFLHLLAIYHIWRGVQAAANLQIARPLIQQELPQLHP